MLKAMASRPELINWIFNGEIRVPLVVKFTSFFFVKHILSYQVDPDLIEVHPIREE